MFDNGIQYSIRRANPEDLGRIYEIEQVCFPAAEAAGRDSLRDRISAFPEGFLLLQRYDEVIGFINAIATDEDTISDPMFESIEHHNNQGRKLAIFGVDIHPDYQKKGFSRVLMDSFIRGAENAGYQQIILTCKKELIPYYEKFGYSLLGLSHSVHGGAEWFDMSLEFK